MGKNKEKQLGASKPLFYLLLILIFYILFTIYVALVQISYNHKTEYIIWLFAFLFVLFVLFFWRSGSRSDSILFSLKKTFNKNWPQVQLEEILLLVSLLFLAALLINRVFWSTISKGLDIPFKTFISPIFETILVVFSVVITLLALHYAFQSEKNSAALMKEKGDFLEGFSGFVERINRRIQAIDNDGKKLPIGLLQDLGQNNEKYFYLIECMFLTPFLGHAGLISYQSERRTKKKKSIYDPIGYRRTRIEFARFHKNLYDLIKTNKCIVKILTQDSNNLNQWYIDIQIVDKLLNVVGKSKIKLKENVKSILLGEKGNLLEDIKSMFKEQTKIKDTVVNRKSDLFHDMKTIPTYNEMASIFSTISDEKDRNIQRNLRLCYSDYIPFQMFLVMEIKNNKRKENIVNIERIHNIYDKEEKIEDAFSIKGKFVVLTYVGDKTYREIIEDLCLGQNIPIEKEGGIKFLLERLHAGIYSEDPRECEILHRHFCHYWTQEKCDNDIVAIKQKTMNIETETVKKLYNKTVQEVWPKEWGDINEQSMESESRRKN